jgi:hypothetical protein
VYCDFLLRFQLEPVRAQLFQSLRGIQIPSGRFSMSEEFSLTHQDPWCRRVVWPPIDGATFGEHVGLFWLPATVQRVQYRRPLRLIIRTSAAPTLGGGPRLQRQARKRQLFSMELLSLLPGVLSQMPVTSAQAAQNFVVSTAPGSTEAGQLNAPFRGEQVALQVGADSRDQRRCFSRQPAQSSVLLR